MKLRIMHNGTKLALLTDDGRIAYGISGITLAAGDEGVQILIQLPADEVEVDADTSSDIKSTIDALLSELGVVDDEEE